MVDRSADTVTASPALLKSWMVICGLLLSFRLRPMTAFLPLTIHLSSTATTPYFGRVCPEALYLSVYCNNKRILEHRPPH